MIDERAIRERYEAIRDQLDERGRRLFGAAKDPTLLEDLRRLVEPVTLGDPMRPLLWVSKSHVKLAKALQKMGHTISPNTVRKLLHQLGYGRQANRKANDGR